MNIRNTAIFSAVIFLAVSAWNIGAQEQSDTDEQTDTQVYFLNFQPIPGLNIFGHNFEKVTNVFLIGPIVGIGHNLRGVGISSFGLINTGRVQGFQSSGIFNFANAGMDGLQSANIFNVAKGTVRGIQAAGLFNYASGKFIGIQASGFMNWIEGDMWGLQVGPINRRGEGKGIGIQIGLINISESGNVIPIGLINKVKDGMKHFWIFTDDMLFLNIGYRSGSKIFYTHSNIGIGGGLLPRREGDKLVISRSGFGFEFTLRKFFIDIDVSTGNIFIADNIKDLKQLFFGTNTGIYQVRLIVGFKMYERLGIFAGISYDYLYRKKSTDPDPEDFAKTAPGKSIGNKTHKMGFFGGMQF